MKSGYASIVLLLIFVFFFLDALPVSAESVDSIQAQRAAQGWLVKRFSNARAGSRIKGVKECGRKEGVTLYYVIDLKPSGFIVISGNDEVEPVIALSSQGHFEDSTSNLLKDILDADMSGRITAIKAKHNHKVDAQARSRMRQWLCRKHKNKGRGAARYPDEYLYDTLGLVRLEKRTQNFPWAKA